MTVTRPRRLRLPWPPVPTKSGGRAFRKSSGSWRPSPKTSGPEVHERFLTGPAATGSGHEGISVLQSFDLIRLAQVFVPQQGDRHVAVFPHKVMELAQVEFVTLCQPGFRQQFHDLQFARLVRDSHARD